MINCPKCNSENTKIFKEEDIVYANAKTSPLLGYYFCLDCVTLFDEDDAKIAETTEVDDIELEKLKSEVLDLNPVDFTRKMKKYYYYKPSYAVTVTKQYLNKHKIKLDVDN